MAGHCQSNRELFKGDVRNVDKSRDAEIHRHSIPLVSNAYKVETSRHSMKVHEYALNITLSSSTNLHDGVLSKNLVTQSIRRLITDKVLPQLLPEGCQDHAVINIQLKTIYTLSQFQSRSSSSIDQNLFLFKDLPVTSDLVYKLRIDCDIKFRKSHNLDSVCQDGDILASLIHHKIMSNMIIYDSIYFTRDDSHDQPLEQRLDLISTHAQGISLSRPRYADQQHTVVISTSHSYMTKAFSLIDILLAYITNQAIAHVQLNHDPTSKAIRKNPEIELVTGKEDWFSSFCTILQGFKCQVNKFPERKIFRFNIQQSADELKIRDSTTDIICTVKEHFIRQGIVINYPNLPCLATNYSECPYYPMELCSVLPGQKVPIFRLSSAAREHLYNLQNPNPRRMYGSVQNVIRSIISMNTHIYNLFGIRLNPTPISTLAVPMKKPILRYLDSKFEPKHDFWESGNFFNAYKPIRLNGSWCVVNTIQVNQAVENKFFSGLCEFSRKHNFNMSEPYIVNRPKQILLENPNAIEQLINDCRALTNNQLKLIIFIIDSNESTALNRIIHLSFDACDDVTSTCIRVENLLNERKHRPIFRTLVHKLNTRLGGTNVVYDSSTLSKLNLSADQVMIIGLDVTHPDNELKGVSIVGCAYTYSNNLFQHRCISWPQGPRVEIIGKMDALMSYILKDYYSENNQQLPKHIIIYRDGVSHEEFETVRAAEITKAEAVLKRTALETGQTIPMLSFVIAQKRHTMRFFKMCPNMGPQNPPSGTLIDQDVVLSMGSEFYLYSTTSRTRLARPLHYHVLTSGMEIEKLHKLTYYLCFNFGKTSGSLSMPSSLRYAHNTAYDARSRVIASREFSENKFYTSKFFC